MSSLAPEQAAKVDIESLSTLLHVEHVLLGKICGYDRNKVFIKCSFESGPCAEVNRGLAKGSFLMILGPFTSSSADTEVCEGRGDLLAISHKVVTIEIVIVFKGMPKGLCVSWLAIKQFWCTVKCFGRCRSGHDRC